MSVRDGMLAILTLGPAYGSQLHAEFTERTPHRSPVNVGQIYTTIDRLSKQGLIAGAGHTDDGLPLHTLTEAGTARAKDWMTAPDPVSRLDWTEMLDQVLITASVDDLAARALIDRYRRLWMTRRDAEPDSTTGTDTHSNIDIDTNTDTAARRLVRSATTEQAAAAVNWLEDVLHDTPTAVPYTTGRPRRGRPAIASQAEVGTKDIDSHFA